MPIQIINLALTVVKSGLVAHKEFKWDEEDYKVVYHSHISSLNDLGNHSRRQGEDLVAQLQRDLLTNAL